ncbi:MAG: hypothetical protein JNK26_05130, partial [Candidatus Doudnabacteria bacterium]|nr:hypothetical protein [Candidatus Doudnabacteria bacterium]
VGSKQGRLVSELQYTLTKDDAVLKINKVMVATGFIPAPFTGQESDYKELSDELARIRDEEQDVWAYVTITDCVEDETPDGAAFCYATPAPGFGDLASIVTLSASADDEAIAEADEIVLSAQ